jgi:hypothetical protein
LPRKWLLDEVVDPGTPLNLAGYENELVIGAKGEKLSLTEIGIARDLLGDDAFMQLVTISITNLKKYLTPEQVDMVTSKSYAIKRRMKVEAI